jgi:DNA-binding MarR family transcriptional regulator
LRSTARRDDLGFLLEAFMNKVSHPRGRALAYMADASVTVPQAILMNAAMAARRCTPSALAATMNISLSSASQMVERLVRLGFLTRREDGEDRRRKSIEVSGKARRFLANLNALRAEEFETGAAPLKDETRRELAAAVVRALNELDVREAS